MENPQSLFNSDPRINGGGHEPDFFSHKKNVELRPGDELVSLPDLFRDHDLALAGELYCFHDGLTIRGKTRSKTMLAGMLPTVQRPRVRQSGMGKTAIR